MGTILLHKNRLITNQSQIVTDTTPETYTRPTEWLTMPNIVSGDSVVYLLMGLTEISDNYLAVNCAGNYTVDWGDGSIINYTANTTASYTAYWSGASPSTLTTDGYRQTLIKITPQSGQSLTSINLNVLNTNVKHNTYNRNYFDIKLSAPNLTSFTFVTSPLFQQFEWVGTNKITTFQNFFAPISSVKKIVSIDVSNANTALGVYQLFSGCGSLVEIPMIYPATGCTNFNGMFSGCAKIKTIPLIDTSRATDMTNMFGSTTSLVTIPLLNTSKVTTMSSMFQASGIMSLPLLDTSKVTDMSSMFNGTKRLPTIPSFNTPLLTNISQMFRDSNIVSISYFDTSKVTTSGQYPFYGATKLTTIPNLITSGITNFDIWFNGCTSLTTIPLIDTSNATIMTSMFNGCTSLTTIPLLNTSKVLNMTSMFNGCTSLTTIPLIDTSKVTNMSSAFNNTTKLTTIPQLNLSAVTTMVTAFQNSGIVTLPPLNTISCNSFYWAFIFCYNLSTISTIDTRSATTMSYMFYNCTSLKSTPTFNTPLLTDSSYMFQSCGKLRSVGLFDTSKVTTIANMFNGCARLEEIPAFNVVSATTVSSVFVSNFALTNSSISGLTRTHSYNSNNLSYPSIVTIFNNLGTAFGTQNINVALNPGSTSLTASDRLIATNKGWTVTY